MKSMFQNDGGDDGVREVIPREPSRVFVVSSCVADETWYAEGVSTVSDCESFGWGGGGGGDGRYRLRMR